MKKKENNFTLINLICSTILFIDLWIIFICFSTLLAFFFLNVIYDPTTFKLFILPILLAIEFILGFFAVYLASDLSKLIKQSKKGKKNVRRKTTSRRIRR